MSILSAFITPPARLKRIFRGAQPGFVRLQILKPRSENTPYVVLTTWQNEQAFTNWVGSDDFKLAHQNPMLKDAFKPGGGLEQYEVVITT